MSPLSPTRPPSFPACRLLHHRCRTSVVPRSIHGLCPLGGCEGGWGRGGGGGYLSKLQISVYDIFRPTTAVIGYVIGLRKLSANRQVFVCVCVCVCVRACVRVCIYVCVRTFVRAAVRMCVCVCVPPPTTKKKTKDKKKRKETGLFEPRGAVCSLNPCSLSQGSKGWPHIFWGNGWCRQRQIYTH